MTDSADLASRIAELAVVRPGDVLVVTLQERITKAELQDFADHLRARMPETVQVLTLAGGIQCHVLRPGEEADR